MHGMCLSLTVFHLQLKRRSRSRSQCHYPETWCWKAAWCKWLVPLRYLWQWCRPDQTFVAKTSFWGLGRVVGPKQDTSISSICLVLEHAPYPRWFWFPMYPSRMWSSDSNTIWRNRILKFYFNHGNTCVIHLILEWTFGIQSVRCFSFGILDQAN